MYSNHKEPFLLLSIIFFTVLLSPLALAETIKGQFNCRIKYQEILEMNKGEPSIFSNYENGLKLEDEIKFFYTYKEEDKTLIFFSTDIIFLSQASFLKYGPLSPKMAEFFPQFGEPGRIRISEDNIVAELTGSLSLQRYYDDNWNGILTTTTWMQTHILGLNCFHSIKALRQILNVLE